MDQCVAPALVMPSNPVRDYCVDPSQTSPCLPICCKAHYSSNPKTYGPPEIKPKNDNRDDPCDQCYQKHMRDHRHEHEYRNSNRCGCHSCHDDSCRPKPCHCYDSRRNDDSYDGRRPHGESRHKDMGHHDDSRQPHSSGNRRDSGSPHGSPRHHSPEDDKPVQTKYIIPCYRYEDGRIVRKLPVSAFKRNGMQDQEYSKLLGAANYLMRDPQDISINCNISKVPVSVCDPAKVPNCNKKPFDDYYLRKKPIEISLEDIVD